MLRPAAGPLRGVVAGAVAPATTPFGAPGSTHADTAKIPPVQLISTWCTKGPSTFESFAAFYTCDTTNMIVLWRIVL